MSDFYKRMWINTTDSDNTITKQPNSVFYEEKLKLEWKDENYHLECYVKRESLRLFIYSCDFYFNIGDKTVKLLKELRDLTYGRTDSSCKKVFERYPTVLKLVNEWLFKNQPWDFYGPYIYKRIRFQTEDLLVSAKNISKEIDSLFEELSNLEIDTSLLEKYKNPFEDYDIKIPQWVKKAAIVGGIVLIKVAVKSIGGDVDLDIPDFDGDVDIDIDIDGPDIDGDVNIDIHGDTDVNFDPDLTEIDSDNDINVESYSEGCEISENLGDSHSDNSNTLHEESYNPCFKAQDATLKSQGGGSTIKVTITREPGTSNQFCIELPSGDKIHNVSGTRNTIEINQIVYKLPVLKG